MHFVQKLLLYSVSTGSGGSGPRLAVRGRGGGGERQNWNRVARGMFRQKRLLYSVFDWLAVRGGGRGSARIGIE